MNSKQATRYVKRRMNDELTFKILEHDGIKLLETNRSSSSHIVCVKCNYVNKLECKYCDGCAYPLTQEALEEIKAAEESRMNNIINERLRDKELELGQLQVQMSKMRQDFQSLHNNLQDMKMLELRRLKDMVYGRKKFEQEVVKEMESGKDFGTVLSQKLNPDVMMSYIKNDKKIPRIYREVVMEDLINLKEEISKGI